MNLQTFLKQAQDRIRNMERLAIIQDSVRNTNRSNQLALNRVKVQTSLIAAQHSEKDIQLLRHENYSIRLLTHKYKKQAQQRLTQQYVDQQPLSLGYWKQSPISREEKKQFWRQFYGTFLDYTIQNQLGVVAIDTSKGNQFIGVVISRDITYFSDALLNKLVQIDGLGKQIIALQEQLFKNLKAEYKQIFKQKGTVLNIWGASFKKQHMGKHLLPKMITAACNLGIKRGYRYAYIFASNVRSRVAAEKINFFKIAEYDTHKLQVSGKSPFCLVQKAHQFSTLWIKRLIE